MRWGGDLERGDGDVREEIAAEVVDCGKDVNAFVIVAISELVPVIEIEEKFAAAAETSA